MTRSPLFPLLFLACSSAPPPERYGFVTTLGKAYTLWTVPRVSGVDLIVNRQTGQWGTGYNRAQDLGTVAMKSDSVQTPVEKFTITIEPQDARQGTLIMKWGTFRWTAPIVVQ